MQITVRGAKDKELTKWLKKATLFFAEQLMSPNIYENLSIHIKLKQIVCGMIYHHLLILIFFILD